MESKFFDADFYRASNSDLSEFSDEQALAHFQAYGLNEGRSFSPLINLNFYRENNSDLKDFDNVQLLEHLELFGLNEGREFSALVDLDLYRAVNPDLADFNGIDALQHLKDFGLNEGRTFSPYVDLGFYQEMNSDLKEFTKAEALQHLVNYGLDEKRVFSPYVDLGLYKDSNQDLKDLNFTGTQLIKHLDQFGLNEGRTFSPYVNLGFYQQVNSDLTQFTKAEALQHFLQYGLDEERVFSPYVDLKLYQDLNEDLQESNLTGTQLLKHLNQFGIGEGRQFSYPFDIGYYSSENPDIVTAYANSRGINGTELEANSAEQAGLNKVLFNHFITYGVNEGRRSSDEFDVNVYMNGNQDLSNFNKSQLYKHFRAFGINEERVLSNSYNAEYYKDNNFAPEYSNLQELFKYYITDGIENNEFAVENPKFENEVVPRFDLREISLLGGSKDLTGNLSASSGANPYRSISYGNFYELFGKEIGQEVTLTMTATSPNFDTYLQVIDDNTGEIIAENDNISDDNKNSQLTFTVEAGIDYDVITTSVDANNLGNYNLTAEVSAAITETVKIDGSGFATLNDELFNPSRKDTYRQDRKLDLTGVADEQVVKLRMISESFDPYLQLIDAKTGEVLAHHDNIGVSSTDAEILFTRQKGVEYIVRFTSSTPETTGEFYYDMSLVSQESSPSIAKDQTIWGIIDSENEIDVYNLDTTGIATGTEVRINLISEEFDTRVTVKDDSGTLLFQNDDISGDSTNSRLDFTIADGANYKIEVDSASVNQFGEYDLIFSTLNTVNPSPAVAFALPATAATQDLATNTPQLRSAAVNKTGITLQDSALNNLLSGKDILDRNDILGFFNEAQKDGTISRTEKTDLGTLVDKASHFHLSDSVKFLTGKVVKYTINDMSANDFNNLVTDYFFGTRRPRTDFVGEGDTARGGKKETNTINFTYQTILGDFYGSNPGDGRTVGQPRIRDINQQYFGDCYYLASLGALFKLPQKEGNTNQNSDFINSFITINGKETYNGTDYESWTFRF
ncbi:MAG: hypothetical protein AAF063_04040, partial [Cyanobacteria bacterium J06643_5]